MSVSFQCTALVARLLLHWLCTPFLQLPKSPLLDPFPQLPFLLEAEGIFLKQT